MCCSTCKNWSTCKEVHNDSYLNLLRHCYVGDKVSIEKRQVLRHINVFKHRYLKGSGVILVSATKIKPKLFKVKALCDAVGMGARYTFNIKMVDAYFDIKQNCYKIYIDGMEHSIEKDAFERTFRVKVDNDVYKMVVGVQVR